MEKISSYNIFNYLVPGTLFVGLGEQLTSVSLIQSDLLIALILYYFIGLIISRIGSLIVEPLLKGFKILRFANYKDFVKASASDPKIELLSEQNNMYRTLCSLSIVLFVLVIYDQIKPNLPWGSHVHSVVVLVALTALFMFSYRKQTRYISQRVEIAQHNEEE